MSSLSSSNIPSPRTSPTVKSQVSTNKRSLQSWSVTLGPVHSIVLVGVVTGCMAFSFILGFFSGQKVGVETALNNNLSSAMRLPIDTEAEIAAGSEEAMKDVYARLNDNSDGGTQAQRQPARADSGAARKQQMPELGSIKTTDVAPVAEALAGENGARANSELDAVKNALHTKSAVEAESEKMAKLGDIGNNGTEDLGPQVRVLGEKPAFGYGDSASSQGAVKTLGAIAKESQAAGQVGLAQQANNIAAVVSSQESAKEKKSAESASSSSAAAKEALTEKTKKASAADVENARREVKGAKEKAKAQEKTVKEEAPVKNSLSRGWYAQIVAQRSLSDAETVAKKLKASGFQVVIENALVRGENYYRVLVGPEDTRTQAERLIQQLKRESYLKSEPFLRMVK